MCSSVVASNSHSSQRGLGTPEDDCLTWSCAEAHDAASEGGIQAPAGRGMLLVAILAPRARRQNVCELNRVARDYIYRTEHRAVHQRRRRGRTEYAMLCNRLRRSEEH